MKFYQETPNLDGGTAAELHALGPMDDVTAKRENTDARFPSHSLTTKS
jgi:hypothetical protein